MDNKDPDKYLTVSGKQSKTEIKFKGSRFISTVYHVEKRESAEKFYQEMKKYYQDIQKNLEKE